MCFDSWQFKSVCFYLFVSLYLESWICWWSFFLWEIGSNFWFATDKNVSIDCRMQKAIQLCKSPAPSAFCESSCLKSLVGLKKQPQLEKHGMQPLTHSASNGFQSPPGMVFWWHFDRLGDCNQCWCPKMAGASISPLIHRIHLLHSSTKANLLIHQPTWKLVLVMYITYTIMYVHIQYVVNPHRYSDLATGPPFKGVKTSIWGASFNRFWVM